MSVNPTDSIVIESFKEGESEVTGQPVKGKLFTEEEVTSIRRQEKDKLYSKMESESERVKALEEQLAVLAAEREESLKLKEEAARKEQEILRQREEAELSAKELIARRESEFNQKLQEVEQEFTNRLSEVERQRQAQEALLERERELQAAESYRQRRLAEEQETIIPELRDLVSGNNQEEIEQSIAVLRDRSSAIMQSIQQATQQSRLRGAGVTAPSNGPMENQQEYQTLTAEDIRNMPMDQYMKMRDRLLTASRNPRGRF